MTDRSQTTIAVPRDWLAAVANLLDRLAGEGIGVDDFCMEPADLLLDLAGVLRLTDADNPWEATIKCLMTN